MPELQIAIQPSPMKEEFMKKGIVMDDNGKLAEPKKKILKPGQDVETNEMAVLKEYLPFVKKFVESFEKMVGDSKEEDNEEEEM